MLRLDRLRALVDVYPGVEREDEMVAAFDYCLHGRGGAAPSIDTAMHGLVDAAHVDHLHPDAGIALATAADGEALTKECFGDRVVWVPWRRPGFQLGLDIAAVQRANPQAIGVILGGHGITAWGATSDECEAQLAGDHPHRRRRSSPSAAGPSRSGRCVPGYEPLPRAERRERAAALAPVHPRPRLAPTGRRSATSPTADVVLDFLARARAPASWPRWAPRARTTSCAPRSGRWCWTCRRPRRSTRSIARLRELHAAYREDYRAYYERHADAGLARRCAAPTRRSCWCPASACSASARTSRPPGSPASSTSTRST